MITLIVARDRRGAIGRQGGIPWDIPEDLAFFSRETMGGAVIMGRLTWESLPARARPLKRRMNIVVSRDAAITEHVADSPQNAVAMAQEAGHRRIYGMGGAAIYAALLPQADRLLITEVDLDVPDADAFFPRPDLSLWRLCGQLAFSQKAPSSAVHEYIRNSRRNA